MYIEQLRLPTEGTPLMIEGVLACQDPNTTARVNDITQLVRSTIEPIMAKTGTFDLESSLTSNTPAANCYGSNLVLSEALSASQIPHLVAFANDHVFTIVTDATEYAYMADGNSPKFNGNMMPALSRSELRCVPEFIKNHQRAVLRLDSSVIVQNSKLFKPVEVLGETNAWLTHSPNAEIFDKRGVDEALQLQNTKLLATVFEPELGRSVIVARSNLHRAIYLGDLAAAATSLHEIAGIYPEIDNRNIDKPRAIGGLALGLAINGDIESARQVVNDLASSYDLVENLKLQLWPADQLRKIGFITGNPDLIEESIRIYIDLQKLRPNNHLIAGKLRAARNRLSLLAR